MDSGGGVFIYRQAGVAYAVFERNGETIRWPFVRIALPGFDGEMWEWEEEWPWTS